MTLTRVKWVRSLLAALAVMVVPGGTSSLWAQGLGPDPFRPYNRQYDPYTYPMGPASPEAGQSVGSLPRDGNRGANQFQSYLDDLSGSSRRDGERYGIEVPYYRSSVDPSFRQGTRDYQPNREADRTYEQTQEMITRKYLAYFAEKDPKKRAALLRDYDRARDQAARALSTRRASSSSILEAATRTDYGQRRPPSTARGTGTIPTTADRSTRSASTPPPVRGPSAGRGRTGAGSIPPPPPLFGEDSFRRTSPRRSPSEVLERSRRLSPADDRKPRSASPVRSDVGTARQPFSPGASPD